MLICPDNLPVNSVNVGFLCGWWILYYKTLFFTKLTNESKFSWDLLEYLLDISKMTNLKYKVAKGGTIGTMSIHTCHKWGAVGATNRVSHMIVYPHLYLHCMFNISPLHPHCIPIIISPFYLHYVPHYCISPLHLHYILVISALYLPLYQPVNSPWSPL